jgi:hypothetical protein
MDRVIIGFDVGIRNMSFCELLVDASKKCTVQRWEVVDLMDGDAASANKIKFESLHQKLECFLNSNFPPELPVNAIGIELQPQGRLSNLRMQIISHLIYAFFRTRLNQGAIENVRFIAAKLKYPKKHMIACGLTCSRVYKERKRNSVVLCRHLTPGLPDRGKIDDLADSFLIAYACIP